MNAQVVTKTMTAPGVLPAALRLGPVRLAVTDLDRAIDFYTRIVGLTVSARRTEAPRVVAYLGNGRENVVELQAEPDARPAGRAGHGAPRPLPHDDPVVELAGPERARRRHVPRRRR